MEETKEDPDHPKNEIKIAKTSQLGRNLTYIHGLLVKDKLFDKVVLRGAGQAIPKVVQIVDICRRWIKGIHTHNEITTLTEEFTNKQGETRERNIIMIKVTLYLKAPSNAHELVGY